MYRQVIEGEQLRAGMKAGIDKATDLVKVTMGVRGKSIILDTNPYTKPLITNDGVTILRDMIFEDRVENKGLKMLKEAAEMTNDNAGDGTTTTAILMQSIIDQGMRAIQAGADGIALRSGIREATDKLLEYLKTEKVDASDIETLAATATISCRDPKLGRLIAEAVQKAGKDGMITIEDRVGSDTIVESVEGIRLQGGLLGDIFINLPERRQAVFNDVPILVTTKTITIAPEMGRIMEMVSNMGKKEVVIIAAGIEGDALATAAVNWQKKLISVLPVRVLAYGDMAQGVLKDIAAITGATFIDENEKNIIDVTQEDFGRAAKTVTDKHETTIVSDDEESKTQRVKDLATALDSSREFERENLRERIAKLRSAMFTVKVGGKTESERNELKTRVDDAIKAAKAALEGGVVAGGGSALYRAERNLEKPDLSTDKGFGYDVVSKACLKPINQMAENSGHTLDRSDFFNLKNKNNAVDFTTGEVVDAFKDGIVDPLKVVTEALENASTQASLFLTLDGGVYDVQPEQQEKI